MSYQAPHTPLPATEPGTVLAGHRLEAVVGRGGMGVVWRATHLALGRTVALKVISPALAADAGFRRRFAQECRLAASLDHPHVVPIIDAGEDRGFLYVSMRLVSGPDLRTMLAAGGPLDPTRALHLMSQVGSALDAAHAAGLVHRDVKPANILIERRDGRDHAYLADFGLVKRLDGDPGVTGSHGWIGTVDYVSPEQVRGEPVGAPVDLYALGATLFTALTARVPFPRPDVAAQLYATVNDPVPPLAACGVQAPRGLDQVIGWAMAKDPARRPTTGTALCDAAAKAVSGPTADLLAWRPPAGAAQTAPPPADPEGAPTAVDQVMRLEETRARRHRPRRLGVAAASAAAVAALAVGAVAFAAGHGNGANRSDRTTEQVKPPTGPTTERTFKLASATTSVANALVPDQPVASAPSTIPGVGVDVYLVKRISSQVALVVFSIDVGSTAIANNANPGPEIEQDLSLGGQDSSASDISLLDPVGLKEYETYSSNPSQDGSCLCSETDGLAYNDGGTFYLAAYTAAPPQNVTSVSFVSQLASVPNLPVTS